MFEPSHGSIYLETWRKVLMFSWLTLFYHLFYFMYNAVLRNCDSHRLVSGILKKCVS